MKWAARSTDGRIYTTYNIIPSKQKAVRDLVEFIVSSPSHSFINTLVQSCAQELWRTKSPVFLLYSPTHTKESDCVVTVAPAKKNKIRDRTTNSRIGCVHVLTGVYRAVVASGGAKSDGAVERLGQQLERERVANVGSRPIVIKTLTAAGTAKSIVPYTHKWKKSPPQKYF